MMNRFVIFCAGLCLTAPALSQASTEMINDENTALAETFVDEIALGGAKPPVTCDGLQLDDTQKAALKQAKWEYKKQKNTTDAAVKNAWMDYSHTLKSMTSTKDDGMTAAVGVKDAMTAAGMAKADFELKVFYDILRPEQREPALKCVMKMMKQRMMEKLKRMCSKLPPESKP
ncbi:hypothetical protein [Bdellovibrio sp.]|uniref:hypothetical protein n=1 Tax=Bdellovibrio sp. TaxID=28201 RepID=UPI0039E33FFE